MMTPYKKVNMPNIHAWLTCSCTQTLHACASVRFHLTMKTSHSPSMMSHFCGREYRPQRRQVRKCASSRRAGLPGLVERATTVSHCEQENCGVCAKPD